MAAATRAAVTFVGHDHFHCDFLERDLVVDQVEQPEGAFIRHVVATEFDARGFSGEFRMRRDHLPVEHKGNVSVEFFLELVQLLIGPVPRSRLVHRQEDFIGVSVVRKKIDHRRVGHAARGYLLLLIMILLLISGHSGGTSNVQRPTSNAQLQNLDTRME